MDRSLARALLSSRVDYEVQGVLSRYQSLDQQFKVRAALDVDGQGTRAPAAFRSLGGVESALSLSGFAPPLSRAAYRWIATHLVLGTSRVVGFGPRPRDTAHGVGVLRCSA
jgi:hypothetical protein